MTNCYLKFSHGLGDATQFTCVLRHLKKHHPDWVLYARAMRGKHSAFYKHCEHVWHDQEAEPTEQFDHVYDLAWHENYNAYTDCPSTKVTNCLREVFQINPDPELLTYDVSVRPEILDRMRSYLGQIGCIADAQGRFNAVCIHYEGNTSSEKKNLTHDLIAALVRKIIARGHVPVILDWDKRSPLPNGKTIHCPGVGPNDIWGNTGTGDAERITALISLCSMMVGIDSGPQKCAGATSTPTLAIWTQHDPLRYYDLSANVTHLFNEERDVYPLLKQSKHWEYFNAHYKWREYTPGNVLRSIVVEMEKILPTVNLNHMRDKVVLPSGVLGDRWDTKSLTEPLVDTTAMRTGPLVSKLQGDITLTVPQGIGDLIWIYQKFANYVDRIHWRIGVVRPTAIQLRACGIPGQGSFLELLPQTASVSFGLMTQEDYDNLFKSWPSMVDVLGKPVSEYACNRALEEGTRLEDIDPEYPPLETIPIKSDWVEGFDKPYVCLYVCGSTFNSDYRERFKLWSVEQWARLVDLFYRKYGLKNVGLVILGANYDRDVAEEVKHVIGHASVLIDLPPAQVVHILKGAKAFLGYQSGLGVIADQVDTPSLFVNFPCYSKMKYSWCKRKNQESGVFNAALFTDGPEGAVEGLRMPL